MGTNKGCDDEKVKARLIQSIHTDHMHLPHEGRVSWPTLYYNLYIYKTRVFAK